MDIREIKFRAWIKELKWLVPVERIYFDIKMVEVNLTEENGDTVEYNFDEVVLMQYTGFKDRNGKEIYEGDIIKTNINLVLIKQSSMGFMPFRKRDGSFNKQTNWMCVKKGEVVGNIYENPELLKEAK